jgi:hypothetical protein
MAHPEYSRLDRLSAMPSTWGSVMREANSNVRQRQREQQPMADADKLRARTERMTQGGALPPDHAWGFKHDPSAEQPQAAAHAHRYSPHHPATAADSTALPSDSSVAVRSPHRFRGVRNAPSANTHASHMAASPGRQRGPPVSPRGHPKPRYDSTSSAEVLAPGRVASPGRRANILTPGGANTFYPRQSMPTDVHGEGFRTRGFTTPAPVEGPSEFHRRIAQRLGTLASTPTGFVPREIPAAGQAPLRR